MSPGLALTLALPPFEEISSRFPGVQLQLVEDYTEALHDRLLQGTVDLAILNGPHLEKPNLVTTALMEEQICLIGLATNPHLPKQSIDVRALSDSSCSRGRHQGRRQGSRRNGCRACRRKV